MSDIEKNTTDNQNEMKNSTETNDSSIEDIEINTNTQNPLTYNTLATLGKTLKSAFESFINIKVNIAPVIETAVHKLVPVFRDYTKSIISNLYKIDYSYLFAGVKEAVKEFVELLNQCLYDAKWFPYAMEYVKKQNASELTRILKNTRYGTKRQIKEIDNLIYKILNKTQIETIRKSWRNYEIPTYMIRILNQAVYAYHRGEYAITAITLSTLWQGMISEKINPNGEGYRKGDKTKNQFKKIIDMNEWSSTYDEFFNEYIMYNCNSKTEIKEDVPGRHGYAHSWFNKYPTKKAALNAILFTDFIIKAEKVNET